MPKMHKDFPAQLSLGVSVDLRQRLQALGYYLGNGGEYAGAVRNLLHEGMERYVSNLGERERRYFDEMLANVRAREVLK